MAVLIRCFGTVQRGGSTPENNAYGRVIRLKFHCITPSNDDDSNHSLLGASNSRVAWVQGNEKTRIPRSSHAITPLADAVNKTL